MAFPQLSPSAKLESSLAWIPAFAGTHGLGMAFYTYLLASAPYGTLYCGHTDSLATRVRQHKEKVYKGFTAKYGVSRLVWYAVHETREGARLHERQIKKWNRAWKIRLIEEDNRDWADLSDKLNQ